MRIPRAGVAATIAAIGVLMVLYGLAKKEREQLLTGAFFAAAGLRIFQFMGPMAELRYYSLLFVVNYCPLVFMDDGARNLTPDKLPKAEQEPLFAACDDALQRIVKSLRPELVIGVGAFARDRAERALPDFKGKIGTVLHPSPASPKANRGWAGIAEQELRALGAL